MASFRSQLTRLQQELIERFFAEEDRFWLTGGAALAGYHLGHRATHDVDLFGPRDCDLEQVSRRIEDLVRDLGGEVTRLRTTPTFVRLFVSRDEEQCEVDLVRDATPRVAPVELRGRVRVDPLRELAANKLAALVSRSEVRDLVDLRHLLEAGVDLQQAISDASRKDAGLSPDTLALSVSWIPLEQVSALASRDDVTTLTRFRDELLRRLRALAFPGLEPPG